MATCASPQSRNRTVGFALGEGQSLDEIVGGMHMVAEGIKSAGPLVGLAQAHGVEMPIAEQVQAIVEGRCSPADGTDEPDAPSLPPRMGRDAAAGAPDMSGLFHSYDLLPEADDEAAGRPRWRTSRRSS